AAASRRTVSRLAPGPEMDTASETGNSPEVRAIVRRAAKKVLSKLIVSAPGEALASRIACRNEPGPASLALITVKTAGATRPSRACTRSLARTSEALRAGRARQGAGKVRASNRRSRRDMTCLLASRVGEDAMQQQVWGEPMSARPRPVELL